MINEENICDENRGPENENTGYVTDSEERLAYVLTVFFALISAALSVICILYPETAEITADFLETVCRSDISGAVSVFIEGIKNVFI